MQADSLHLLLPLLQQQHCCVLQLLSPALLWLLAAPVAPAAAGFVQSSDAR
jgi:hypothetical protein